MLLLLMYEVTRVHQCMRLLVYICAVFHAENYVLIHQFGIEQ